MLGLERRASAPCDKVVPRAEAVQHDIGASAPRKRLEHVIGEVGARRGHPIPRHESPHGRVAPRARQDVREDAQGLRVLAEAVLCLRVGEESARFRPEPFQDRPSESVRLAPQQQGPFGLLQRSLDPRRAPNREEVEEVVERAHARSGLSARRAPRREVRPLLRPVPHPVHEAPSRQVLQESVGVLVPGETVQGMAHARLPLAEEGEAVPPEEKVPVHQDPAHRVRARLLVGARGELHRHEPAVAPRPVVDAYRKARQPRIGRQRVQDLQLDARVARVHLLLVIRAVEEHLVQARLDCPPRKAEDVLDRRVVTAERGLGRKRIARLRKGDATDFQRLVRRLYRHTAPASAPPPRRRERGVRAPVRDELVREDVRERLALPCVAIALRPPCVIQGLRPAPRHFRAEPAGRLQFRVPAEVVAKVPPEVPRLMRRHRKRLRQVLDGVDDASGRFRLVRLIRAIRRKKHPAVRTFPPARAVDSPADGNRLFPVLSRRLFMEEPRARHPTLVANAKRLRRASVRHHGAFQRRDMPGALSGRQRRVVGSLGLQEKAAAKGKLRDRRGGKQLPAGGLQAMRAGFEPGDFVALVIPVLHQPTLRPARHRPTVQAEYKPLVRRDIKPQGRAVRDEVVPEPEKPARHFSGLGPRHGIFAAGGNAKHVMSGHPDPRSRIRRLDDPHVLVAARIAWRTHHLPDFERDDVPRDQRRERGRQTRPTSDHRISFDVASANTRPRSPTAQ